MTRLSARVPLRLGLAGGGTDLPSYVEDHGGLVLNTTINRYAYVFLEPTGDGKIRLEATDLSITEELAPTDAGLAQSKLVLHAGVIRSLFRHIAEIRNVRECMGGVRIVTFVDAPTGSGLGSSSALVVGMIRVIAHRVGVKLSQAELARMACKIERNDLQMHGGRQDQYAASFGGLNLFEFRPRDIAMVNPIVLRAEFLNEFESSLVICFTGISRVSGTIIEQQETELKAHSAVTLEALHRMKQDALAMAQFLSRSDMAGIARTMNHSWEAKKRTASGVSNSCIDRLYAVAMEAGALAGKVSGAGGGGFMMFIVAPMRRYSVIAALNAAGGDASSVQLVRHGVQTWSS